jgi:carbon monoxide dehydrogenase subunit G
VRLENSFTVAGPPDAAWELLMDVPRVIRCMPGATLDEVVDESRWKATMQIKLGAVALTFLTEVTREAADEAAKVVRLDASAREKRNRGRAKTTIESTLAAVEEGTRVDIATDLTLSGPVAQYGQGLIQDISSQLVESFAECLQAQIALPADDASAEATPPAKPIAGLRLLVRSLRRALARLLRRRRA